MYVMMNEHIFLLNKQIMKQLVCSPPNGHQLLCYEPLCSITEDSDEESAVVRLKQKTEKGGIYQKTNTAALSKAKGVQ